MEYLFKYLLAPILISYFLYQLGIYLFALSKWGKAKGNVVDYNYGFKATYLVIEFRTDDGKKVEFEGRVYPLISAKSSYPINSEVDILYSPSNPGTAMVNSIVSPLVYLGLIALVIFGVYFYGQY